MVEGSIRLDEIHLQRDQLIAEAIHLYKAGARSYPTREQEHALFAPQQELRMIQHPWLDKLQDYLVSTTVTEYTNFELLKEVIGVDIARISPQGMESQTVGKCMQLLGWTKKKRASDMKWVWERPKADPAKTDAPAPSGPDTTEEKVGDDDVPF
jgi:predicted P-loop ATPase